MKPEKVPVSGNEPNKSVLPRGAVILFLSMTILAGSVLRLWDLGGIPAGAWIDEAIQGIQGIALRHGEKLPPTEAIPYQPLPTWLACEVVATRLCGDTLLAIRAPAAIIGTLAIPLAFLAGRALAGTVSGLGAAAFIAGSFWHIQYSRIALPCVFVTAEGLLISWLLLGRSVPGMFSAGALAVVCLLAPYGYAASLITPVMAVALLMIRWHGGAEHRPSRRVMVTLAVCSGILIIMMIVWKPQGFQRTAELAGQNRDALGNQILGWLRSVTWSTGEGRWYWHNYPPGAPRFARIELAFLGAGVGVVWWSNILLRWQRWGWSVWALLSVIPEWFGGEAPHLSRGLPQLAPAAVAVGVAVAALVRQAPRLGSGVAIGLMVTNIGWTAHRLFVRFAHDPVVEAWYLKPDQDAAERILAETEQGPIRLSPVFEYEKTPVMLFHLGPAIRDGRIIMTSANPGNVRLIAIIREPNLKQPVSVLYESKKPSGGGRHLLLVYLEQLMEGPARALSVGKLVEARRGYEQLNATIPESAAIRSGLGITLFQMGRIGEAVPHLEYALSCKPEGQMKLILDDLLGRARGGRILRLP